MINFPPLVILQGPKDGAAAVAAIDGDVVFPTLLTQELEQFLQFPDFHHTVAAEAARPILGDFAFAYAGAQAEPAGRSLALLPGASPTGRVLQRFSMSGIPAKIGVRWPA